MKHFALLLLATLAVPVNASPVHVALKSAPSVAPGADGFFTLGSVADLSGGDAALRTRLAAISVGRAPLDGETRHLTRGDLALKLRQAGCDPDKQAVLEGAASADVTTEAPPAPTPGPSPIPGEGSRKKNSYPPLPLAAPSRQASVAGSREGPGVGASSSLIHRGDAVTIVIQSGALTITAPGIARDSGGAGDSIRVHRDGVMTDLSVSVVDAKTVQLEI